MDRRDRNFEKELAKINAQLTITVTGSSIFAIFGASLIILGATIGSDAITKIGFENKILTIFSSVYSQVGMTIFVIGLSVLLIAQFAIPKKIDKIK